MDEDELDYSAEALEDDVISLDDEPQSGVQEGTQTRAERSASDLQGKKKTDTSQLGGVDRSDKLPEPWVYALSTSQHKWYYYNPVTDKGTYDKNQVFVKSVPAELSQEKEERAPELQKEANTSGDRLDRPPPPLPATPDKHRDNRDRPDSRDHRRISDFPKDRFAENSSRNYDRDREDRARQDKIREEREKEREKEKQVEREKEKERERDRQKEAERHANYRDSRERPPTTTIGPKFASRPAFPPPRSRGHSPPRRPRSPPPSSKPSSSFPRPRTPPRPSASVRPETARNNRNEPNPWAKSPVRNDQRAKSPARNDQRRVSPAPQATIRARSPPRLISDRHGPPPRDLPPVARSRLSRSPPRQIERERDTFRTSKDVETPQRDQYRARSPPRQPQNGPYNGEKRDNRRRSPSPPRRTRQRSPSPDTRNPPVPSDRRLSQGNGIREPRQRGFQDPKPSYAPLQVDRPRESKPDGRRDLNTDARSQTAASIAQRIMSDPATKSRQALAEKEEERSKAERKFEADPRFADASNDTLPTDRRHERMRERIEAMKAGDLPIKGDFPTKSTSSSKDAETPQIAPQTAGYGRSRGPLPPQLEAMSASYRNSAPRPRSPPLTARSLQDGSARSPWGNFDSNDRKVTDERKSENDQKNGGNFRDGRTDRRENSFRSASMSEAPRTRQQEPSRPKTPVTEQDNKTTQITPPNASFNIRGPKFATRPFRSQRVNNDFPARDRTENREAAVPGRAAPAEPLAVPSTSSSWTREEIAAAENVSTSTHQMAVDEPNGQQQALAQEESRLPQGPSKVRSRAESVGADLPPAKRAKSTTLEEGEEPATPNVVAPQVFTVDDGDSQEIEFISQNNGNTRNGIDRVDKVPSDARPTNQPVADSQNSLSLMQRMGVNASSGIHSRISGKVDSEQTNNRRSSSPPGRGGRRGRGRGRR